ncbi:MULTISPECIES: DUF3775 domain-containing protein [unclassified Thalassospira]|uniref:DUF3775 domain-containing protein n=1 Tax=unclassified Thalassospira TaxID=2648997 RepID=UPI000A1D6B57|nr:DUF3775 domain-containing protein [Thalassospira sp. MCCC 1A01428]
MSDVLDDAEAEDFPAIDLEKVAFILLKARAFDVQEDVVEPDYGSNGSDDQFREVLEAYGDDATHSELVDAINDLNWDEQCHLVALVWIGRGSFDADQWQEALSEAEDGHTNHTAEYLTGIPLLGDYIEEGLAAFDISLSEIEMLGS